MKSYGRVVLEWSGGRFNHLQPHVDRERRSQPAGRGEDLPSLQFLHSHAGHVDGYSRARHCPRHHRLVRLHSAYPGLSSARLHYKLLANRDRTTGKRAGYNRTKAGDCEYSIDRQTGLSKVRARFGLNQGRLNLGD